MIRGRFRNSPFWSAFVEVPMVDVASLDGAPRARAALARDFLSSLMLALWVTVAWSVCHKGVDHRFYMLWNDAAFAGELRELGADLPRSVLGVPFLHWQPGAGLLAIPARIALESVEQGDAALLITGFLLAILFWGLLWMAFAEFADRNHAWFGCALGMLATPLGYYSLSISSEAVILFPLGVLFLEFSRGLRNRPLNVWAVGAAAALLISVRSYLGVYAWPAMLLLVFQSARRGRRALLAQSGALAACIVAGVAPIFMVNYWMTGVATRSPYQFGDASFSSFDWRSPHAGQVLLETFHGLLPTHPFFILGAVCLVALVVAPLLPVRAVRTTSVGDQAESDRLPGWMECAAWMTVLLGVMLHVYFQGCWYYWWMAQNSFGMRGLVAASVPMLLAFVRVNTSYLASHLCPRWLALTLRWMSWCAALLSAVWSWLMWQQGPMDYLEWSRLFEGQWLRVTAWWDAELLAILSTSGVLAGMAVWMFREAESGHQLDRHAMGSFVLITLAGAYMLERVAFSPPENLSSFYATLTLLTPAIYVAHRLWKRKGWWRGTMNWLAVAGMVIFVVSFARLGWNSRGELRWRDTEYVTFNELDALSAYKTLMQLPRFDRDRIELRGYLVRTLGNQRVVDVERIVAEGDQVAPVRSRGSRTRMREMTLN